MKWCNRNLFSVVIHTENIELCKRLRVQDQKTSCIDTEPQRLLAHPGVQPAAWHHLVSRSRTKWHTETKNLTESTFYIEHGYAMREVCIGKCSVLILIKLHHWAFLQQHEWCYTQGLKDTSQSNVGLLWSVDK